MAAQTFLGVRLAFPVVGLLLAIGLGLTGCNEAVQADVVGDWAMTQASHQYLPPDQQTMSARLTLRSDGRFAAVDLPGAFHGVVGVADRNSGSGTWKLMMRDGRQQIQLAFDESYGTQLEVVRSGNAWTLQYFLGDPDEGRKIELERPT